MNLGVSGFIQGWGSKKGHLTKTKLKITSLDFCSILIH